MSPEANSQIALLFITANPENYAGLAGILSDCVTVMGYPWEALSCGSVRSALRLMRKQQIPIVLCERSTGDDSWMDLLERNGDGDAPCVIVTSRHADEQLWSQALNLGAYDVLAMPFNAEEVRRVLDSAWAHWKERNGRLAAPQRAMAVSAI
jgi:DNA-binding NtrC family response regulator